MCQAAVVWADKGAQLESTGIPNNVTHQHDALNNYFPSPTLCTLGRYYLNHCSNVFFFLLFFWNNLL